MIILAYGIKQPTNGDKGGVFFPALEELCQRMATHDHDDIDSKPISPTSITASYVDAPAVGWTPVGGRDGVFSQDVNLPAGFTTVKNLIEVRLMSTDERVYPSIEKVTATSIRLFAGRDDIAYRVYVK